MSTKKTNGEAATANISGFSTQASAEVTAGKLPKLTARTATGLSVTITPFGNTDRLVKPGMTVEITAVSRHPRRGYVSASLTLHRPKKR